MTLGESHINKHILEDIGADTVPAIKISRMVHCIKLGLRFRLSCGFTSDTLSHLSQHSVSIFVLFI